MISDHKEADENELHTITYINSSHTCPFPETILKNLGIEILEHYINNKFINYIISAKEWEKYFGIDNKMVSIEDYLYIPLTKTKLNEFQNCEPKTIDQYITYRLFFNKIPVVRKKQNIRPHFI